MDSINIQKYSLLFYYTNKIAPLSWDSSLEKNKIKLIVVNN